MLHALHVRPLGPDSAVLSSRSGEKEVGPLKEDKVVTFVRKYVSEKL